MHFLSGNFKLRDRTIWWPPHPIQSIVGLRYYCLLLTRLFVFSGTSSISFFIVFLIANSFYHNAFCSFQFIFSTAVDGKIKAWLYDNMGSRVDYDAPGHSCTTMAYSADGTRYGIVFCSSLSRFCLP